jgi:glycyl-tRNA synthetase beta chain
MTTETLLVELGTEELPPKALKTLALAFRDGITGGLAQRELDFGEVRWFASPRRLAVQVSSVQLQAPSKELKILGPPLNRARDDDGNWTPAAVGFARKQGVEPEQLETIESAKGARLGLRSTAEGVRAKDILGDLINTAIQGLPIPKRMRWGASRIEFVRPVHWIVVMLGQDSDHGEILGLPTANITYGHRFHSQGPLEIDQPENYADVLLDAKVVADFNLRQTMIRDQVEVEASALNATAVIDPDLLDEVTGLVEWPVALTGSFEEHFLEVPAEALISSMKDHQKYFHLVDEHGALKANFITVSNIESTDPVQVIAGNERVIRPRLSDTAFFFETDKKTPLINRVESLKNIVFQQKLGTLYDKSRRVEQLAGAIAAKVGGSTESASRAGLLCKADLITDMVLEFSDMQGLAGSYYAAHDGESEDVASALAQQYWPKFAGDQLPNSLTACAVGLADRLDTLVGIFGIGQAPTGSKDPFALRRASLAVLRIIVEKDLDLDLRECLELAVTQYPADLICDGTISQVFEYMIERFRAWYEDENIPVEVFRAVSAKRLTRPIDIQRRVHAVHAFTALPEAGALAAANKRVSNILGKLDASHEFSDVNTNLLVESEEKGLYSALESIKEVYSGHLSRAEYAETLATLASLRAPIDAFFDGVMVNAEDPALRSNRLSLLKTLRDVFLEVADISQLAVSK